MSRMNRNLIVCLVGFACATVGSVFAGEEAAAPPVAVALDVPVLSAYLWRGQALDDKIVVEPSLTVSKYGLSLNAWANYNADGSYNGDNSHKFSEVDLSATYTREVGPVSLGGGVVQYLFPNQTLIVADESGPTGEAYPSTYEVFISAGLPGIPLAPTLTVYRDLDAIKGFYGVLAVSQSFGLCEKAALVASASLGAGNNKYNAGYFGENKSAFNDLNVGLALPIALLPSLTIKPAAVYTCLPDSSIRDAADDVYGHKELLVGSVTVSYTF